MKVDRKMPISQDGPDDDSNLQLLYGHCSLVKGPQTMAKAKARLAERGIVVR